MTTASHTEAGLTRGQRLMREIRLYLGIAAYLWLCFGVVFLYRAALLEEHGLTAWHFGLAAAKALVLAKFILVLQQLRLGDRHRGQPLAIAVLLRSLLFLAALLALSLLEEVILGIIHGKGAAAALQAFAAGRVAELAASALILWMVLLPYLAFRGLGEALGEDALKRLLFGPR
jgi:hypothetical protein